MIDPRPGEPTDRDPRLAGYADGELTASDRHSVEEWVDTHPAAAEVLRDQQSLARANAEFWAAVEPTLPSDAEWERVRLAVEARCLPRPAVRLRHRGRTRAAVLAVAATGLLALAGALWPTGPDSVRPDDVLGSDRDVAVAPAPRPVADPLAGFAVLPVASPDDVRVESIHGHQPDWMIAADFPFAGELTLAGPDDLTLIEVVPPAGRSETTAVILVGRP